MATQVTVTGKFQVLPGTAAAGTVTWQLSDPIFDPAGSIVAATVPQTLTLDGTGSFSVTLWANDDSTTYPSGTTWKLTGSIQPVGSPLLAVAFGPFSYTISNNMAPTVDLSDLQPSV